jgi:hypothetical protein
MHTAAHNLIAQSHLKDLHRAAAISARRAEARRAAANARGTAPSWTSFAVRISMAHRLAARFAV